MGRGRERWSNLDGDTGRAEVPAGRNDLAPSVKIKDAIGEAKKCLPDDFACDCPEIIKATTELCGNAFELLELADAVVGNNSYVVRKLATDLLKDAGITVVPVEVGEYGVDSDHLMSVGSGEEGPKMYMEKGLYGAGGEAFAACAVQGCVATVTGNYDEVPRFAGKFFGELVEGKRVGKY